MDLTNFNYNYLNKLLENISKEQKSIFLLGDFNVNLLNHNEHNQTNEFLDSLASNSFIPLILQPARITSHSNTLIDNIFPNVIDPDIISGNLQWILWINVSFYSRMQICEKQDFVLATLLCRACDKHSSVQCSTRTTLTIAQYLQSSKIWSCILPHRAWMPDKTSAMGTSYLFLWGFFHCYSFHVIPGSEGRKDAAASLYMHSTEAPTDLFYDFTCSLSEFNQDRESGFFSDTRYFRDVFHGFTHICTRHFDPIGGLDSST